MTEEIELLKEDLETKIENLRKSLATLRTGRASPKMLDGIQVEYYGDKIALNQIASIQVPEPRQLLIKPYDRNDIKAIVSALNASNIGITPINDGNLVRLNVPALTEERRREIAKTAKKYAEDNITLKEFLVEFQKNYREIVKLCRETLPEKFDTGE